MIKDLGIASLIHALEESSNVLHALCEISESIDNCLDIVLVYGLNGTEHCFDQWASSCFHGVGDNKEPRFIISTCRGMLSNEVIWLSEIGILF